MYETENSSLSKSGGIASYLQSARCQFVLQTNLARPNAPESLAGEFYKYFKFYDNMRLSNNLKQINKYHNYWYHLPFLEATKIFKSGN